MQIASSIAGHRVCLQHPEIRSSSSSSIAGFRASSSTTLITPLYIRIQQAYLQPDAQRAQSSISITTCAVANNAGF